MRQLQWIGLFLLMILANQTHAQSSFSFSCAKDTTINGCANACITLKAKIPDIRSSTNNYVINPISGAGGCFRQYVSPATPGTSTNLTVDDTYSSVVNLPFSFPFYDDAASPYNSLIISTNGFISFDVAEAGNYAHWSMAAGNVPNTAYDRSLIMGVYHDLNPFYTTSPTQQIKYEVLGTAPHRRFVMSVYKVPQFGTTCQNLIENTHQIVLYESLGVIEVFVNSAQICADWNQGRKMIGLQNYNQNKGLMAPGRTATGPNWGTVNMNESWRFVPAVGPTLFRGVELYDLSGNLIAVGDTTNIGSNTFDVSFPNVCPQGTTTYVVKSKYAVFNNPNAFVYGTDTVNVISNNPLSANYAATAASCANAGIGNALINVTGAPGPFEYSTDGGVTWQLSNIVNLPAGTYTIQYRQIGTTCVGTTTVVIPQDPNSVRGNYAISSVSCNGGSNGSINITGLNGTGVYQYSINGGNTYQSSGTFNNLAVGTYNVRIRDNSGCIRDTIINVVEPSALAVTASNSNATCSATPNGNITVEASGGTTNYEYSVDGTNFQASPVFAVTNGTYTVTVRDANGCIKTISQVVALTNDLQLQTRPDTTVCFGATLSMYTNGNAANWSWSGPGLVNNNTSSPNATPTALGVSSYTVVATLGQCTLTKTIRVTVNSQVNVNAGQDVSIISGETVQLNATVTGANTYLWTSVPADATLSSTSILNPTATPTATTTYTLTATNAAGCNATDDITVTVIPYCIKVKNAFSPNGDGINDNWQVYDQYDCLSKVIVTVFNRYGNRVYQNRDYRNNWNGTYNGKPVPDGTYYAVVEFVLIDGKKITKNTDLTLIR
jgi:gliding motility-associated-like protein